MNEKTLAVQSMQDYILAYIAEEITLCDLAMSAIRSVGAGIQTSAVGAVLPLLVPQDSLMRYNGMNATMQSVVNFVVPAVVGVVLSFSALGSVLLIDVATAITTMIQENAEGNMRGRVFGLLGAMYSGVLPVGMALFGPLADVVPLTVVMIGAGVVLISIAVGISLSKSFKKCD